MNHNENIKNQNFIIEGASCGSCVAKIEQALKDVSGVQLVEMNFAQRTVSVDGNADSDTLINTLQNIGYGAKPMKNESGQDALDEKSQADLAHYKVLMRNTYIALGVGVPLML